MRRNLPNPVYAAVFQGYLGIEALRDGLVNQDLPPLFQEFDLPLLDADGGIDLGGFAV